MGVVYWISGVLLGLAALLTAVRLLAGPSMLDRAICVDALIAVTMVGICGWIEATGDSSSLPILLVLSLVGFVGSVSIAFYFADAPGGRRGPD